ncbi:hypothetical protein D3C87_301170 [compost metagenome]
MFVVRLVFLLLVLFKSLVAFGFAEDQASSFAQDPRWLRLYQYQKHFGSYHSDVTSEQFFFSPEGQVSPVKELIAAEKAFSENDPTKKYGTLQLPAACVFPARIQVLETILNKKFPKAVCPDLTDWLNRIQVDQVNLVFVGAYSGNAASIMGHSFLRLSNQKRKDANREGIDLLSYVVGYTAHTPASDGRLAYMYKGLTGAYPGFYDIEPYYMKVGLYNNSESRDLWEINLKMSEDQVDLLTKLVWEYTFNAQINYFFIGKNCSYRLLTLLEAAAPNLNVSSRFHGPVLPAETLRAMVDLDFADNNPRFRASIKRRLQEKINQLSPESKKDFRPALHSLAKVKEIKDPNLLDALMDYWLYENYRLETHMAPEKKLLMETTITQAADLQKTSTLQISNEEIRKKEHLSPPFLGHRPHWVELEAGSYDEKESYYAIHARSGLHPSWLYDESYQDISAVEYLGFDLQKNGSDKELWNLLFVRAQTLEDVWQETYSLVKPSWGFHVALGNDCLLCKPENTQERLNISGSFGISQKFGALTLALLPELSTSIASDHLLAAPGVAGLVKWGRGPWSFYLEKKIYVMPDIDPAPFDFRAGYGFTKNAHLMLKAQPKTQGVSFLYFF